MRKMAFVQNDEKVKRIILHETKGGVYLYLCDSIEDVGGFADQCCETLEDAWETALEYVADRSEWIDIGDPQKFCQSDYIRPVRVVGRNIGKPQYGQLEELIEGVWKPLSERKQ